jgi:hypothetical protein
MKAELSFTFESLEELHDFTAKMAQPYLASGSVEVAPSAKEFAQALGFKVETPPEEPRATKVRKSKATAGPDVPASEPVPVDPSNPTTEDGCRAAIVAVNDKFGLVPARKLLTEFGVKRIPELKPEQYADFVKACNAVK